MDAIQPPAPELSCYGKHAYKSEADANVVAARVHRERGTWLRAYPCDFCRQYHLTHTRALPPPGVSWRPPEERQSRSEDDHRDWRRKRGGRGKKYRRYDR